MLRATEESPRIFRYDLLDVWTRTPWWVVPAMFVPICAFEAWQSTQHGVSALATLGLFVAGWIGWTLSEYWLHRTVFHWAPEEGWGKTFHFFVHGVHHTWPNDRYRLVMPPWVSLGLLFGLAGPIALGVSAMKGWGFLSGYCFGYMVYDVAHYWLHHAKLKWGWFKRLKAHHLSHHFDKKHPNRRYGVSFMIWDRVFGTMD